MNAITRGNVFTARFVALVATFAFILSAFPAAFFVAEAVAVEKVTICHATSSHENPYVQQQPNKSADVNGHDSHDGPVWYEGITEDWGDIIPPFDYSGGSYPGKNWDADGQAIYNNNCDVTAPAPTTGTIMVEKVTTEAGESELFDFTGSGEIGGIFQLNGNTQTSFEVTAGEYTISEFDEDGWELASLSCDGGSPVYNGSEVTVDVAIEETITCTFTNTAVVEGPPQCEMAAPAWAATFESLDQGHTKGGDAVAANRSDGEAALGAADWSDGGNTGFVSLGMGGEIVVSFAGFIPDGDGDDISIHEATNGTYPLETAAVAVSQDGLNWYTLTETARNDATEGGNNVTLLDISETSLLWIKYVRVTDTTDAGLHNDDADGFDLDAVDATEQVCDEPQPEEEPEAKIKVFKYVVPNSQGQFGPALPGDFSFQIDNDDPIPFAFTILGALGFDYKPVGGTYTISEIDIPEDYVHVFTHCKVHSGTSHEEDSALDTYNSCHNVPTTTDTVELTDENDLGICVIVNAYTGTSTGGGGDDDDDDNGGGDTDTYLIDGYVWHDDNENTLWDGVDNDDESTTTEDSLAGRTIEITNGDDTFSTTTDETGYYYFEVEAGTWTITEVLPDGWKLTTPAEGSFVVTVPEVVTMSIFDTIFDFFISTAHAAVVGSAGPFNFGNNEDPGSPSEGGGSSGGGGGSYISLSAGGGGGSSGSDADTSSGDTAPTGQVLGEQVSVVPVGAPDAGAGGAAPVEVPVSQLLLAPLTATMRGARNVR